MKRTTIWLADEQDAALKKIADRRTKYAEHVRRAIDFYLEEEAQPYGRRKKLKA